MHKRAHNPSGAREIDLYVNRLKTMEIEQMFNETEERLKNAEARIAELEKVVFAFVQERFTEAATFAPPVEPLGITQARRRMMEAMNDFLSKVDATQMPGLPRGAQPRYAEEAYAGDAKSART
jgi:hypothetical protein